MTHNTINVYSLEYIQLKRKASETALRFNCCTKTLISHCPAILPFQHWRTVLLESDRKPYVA